MAKYRKKPVVVDAEQFDGSRAEAERLRAMVGGFAYLSYGTTWHLEIDTPEGVMTAGPGYWIVRGVQGEFYPVKPDIFAATYEPVEAPAPPEEGT